MSEKRVVFSGETFRALRAPLVYVWRRGDTVMYVGVGTSGAARPFQLEHHRLFDVEPADTVEMLFCASIPEAEELEDKLIEELKPSLNFKPKSPAPRDIGAVIRKRTLQIERLYAYIEAVKEIRDRFIARAEAEGRTQCDAGGP